MRPIPAIVARSVVCALADLRFLEGGGDFGNASERSERALKGSGLKREMKFEHVCVITWA